MNVTVVYLTNRLDVSEATVVKERALVGRLRKSKR